MMPWEPGSYRYRDARRQRELTERRSAQHAAAVARRRKAKRGGKR